MATNTEDTTETSRDATTFEILWHENSGYGSRYQTLELGLKRRPDYTLAAQLVSEHEDVDRDDVRVDAVTQVTN